MEFYQLHLQVWNVNVMTEVKTTG